SFRRRPEPILILVLFLFVIPAKAGTQRLLLLRRDFRRTPLTPSFRRRPESILPFAFSLVVPAKAGTQRLRFFVALRTDAAFVPVGFRPPSWRPGHFLCLHKESNQRNAPSVTRRRRSRRFATADRVRRQGSCPVAECAPSMARPACGARGCFRP